MRQSSFYSSLIITFQFGQDARGAVMHASYCFKINQVKLTAHLAIIVARKFAETSGTCSVTEIGDFCGSHFCSRKINPSGAQRSLNRETANGCGKHLKEKMCGICGTL
jgi:hypothetical protein